MALHKKCLFCLLVVVALVIFLCYFNIYHPVKLEIKSQYDNFGKQWFRPSTTFKSSPNSFNITKEINLNPPPNCSGSDLENLFAELENSVEIQCQSPRRLGNIGDGGWDLCTSGRYDLRKPCLVYSFGINNDWSFDDDIVKNFDCTVRSFDPSMTLPNQKRGNNIFFYKEGLGGKTVMTSDKMWRLNTLSSFLEIFNEGNTTIDYLKIDIEYYEWEALEAALEHGSLRLVKQLGFEIHTDELFKKTTTVENYHRFFKIFRNLRKAGFYKWYSHLNPMSMVSTSTHSGKSIKCCFEFVYLNSNFA